ncbi:MAG: methyltransferase domain-containing protein [Dehalococcoidia bacterium]|nr:methyltransferase domain-containing protein [Dehalococcoidia bacterium]
MSARRATTSRRDAAARFGDTYASAATDVFTAVQREVFGADTYVSGYTTVAQAELLADRLGLAPGDRLLDLGAGLGWPALHLVEKTGCRAVLTDVLEPGLRGAIRHARRQRIGRRCAFVMAGAAHLPFRAGVFDAVTHTDAL